MFSKNKYTTIFVRVVTKYLQKLIITNVQEKILCYSLDECLFPQGTFPIQNLRFLTS